MIGTITRAAGELEPGTIELPDGQAVTFLALNLSQDLARECLGAQVEFDMEEEGVQGVPQAFNIRQVH